MMRAFPIFLTFFVMGFGDVVGTLVGFAREQFAISAAMAGLLPFVGFVAYGVLSVPAGVLSEKFGKKNILIAGLSVTLLGFLIAMFMLNSYWSLVGAIFLVGSGLTVVQVAGNPMMRDVSDEKQFSRNLTFAQFIKSVGSMSGPLLIAFVVGVWTNLFPIYVVGTLLALLWVMTIPQGVKNSGKSGGGGAGVLSSFKLLGNGYVFLMVMSIFLYVGAEVGVNSWIATYLNREYAFDLGGWATLGIGFFFFAVMVGRFLSSIILNYLSPQKFFVGTSLLSLVGVGGLFMSNQWIAIASIAVIGLSFASIFPLVFSILIDAMPEKSNELSGLMCMAIAGGAVMPLLMGVLADYSIRLSFVVPFVSFLFITAVAFYNLKLARLKAH